MGSLHDTVTWYKIRHARWQKNVTASKTKKIEAKVDATKKDFFQVHYISKTKRFSPAKRDFSLFWMS